MKARLTITSFPNRGRDIERIELCCSCGRTETMPSAEPRTKHLWINRLLLQHERDHRPCECLSEGVELYMSGEQRRPIVVARIKPDRDGTPMHAVCSGQRQCPGWIGDFVRSSGHWFLEHRHDYRVEHATAFHAVITPERARPENPRRVAHYFAPVDSRFRDADNEWIDRTYPELPNIVRCNHCRVPNWVPLPADPTL